jgi:transposase
MARVGTASRLAVWAAVAPGHAASAGQPQSGRTRPGNQPLRTVHTQLAHAAARPQETYLSALSRRLGARRGKKRAIVAVAHSRVVSAFHLRPRQDASIGRCRLSCSRAGLKWSGTGAPLPCRGVWLFFGVQPIPVKACGGHRFTSAKRLVLEKA